MANQLAAEASPYLRQHADNPVDWRPWGEAAFAEAARRDVPVLLSVGYSSCHWCHVMAHESFEDPAIATVMNDRFVNVKVDREERPDVDAIYMDAVQAMTGRGGWPMTVFLTPSGEPFYGGTYYPPETFTKLLDAIGDAWANRRGDLTKNTTALRQAVGRTATMTAGDDLPPAGLVGGAAAALTKHFDRTNGGFGAAPKFPTTGNIEVCLLELLGRDPDDAIAKALTVVVGTTLDAMASGGLYDHIGGGFARYCVDERWLVPHFEKMLYDQALLIRLYARAASALAARFDTSRWRMIVGETIEYLETTMRLPGGAFAAAEDADSPGPDGANHEGLFTTWTPDEVAAVLGADAAALCSWYDITAEGNFEGRSIPNRLHQRARLIRPAAIDDSRRQLFAARELRPRPERDDKVITEWNALLIAALAEAGALFGERRWIELATDAAQFLLDELRDDDRRWLRVWHPDGDPPARHDALAADHAALVDAFTRLAEATGEARWIYEAMDVADELLDRFWDPGEGGLFTTPDDGEQLITRQKDLLDNATPSANSTAAVALLRLSALTGEARFANHADRILKLIAPLAPKSIGGFTHALTAVALRHQGITEVVIPGAQPALLAAVRRRWRPHVVVATGERYESPLWTGREDGSAYVCEQGACQLPVTTAAALSEQLDARDAARWPPKVDASALQQAATTEPSSAGDAATNGDGE